MTRERVAPMWTASRLGVKPWLRPLSRLRVYGVERVPAEGGVVVAANHIAALDIFALGMSSERVLRYMAKVELWSAPVVGHLMPHTGCVPVRRGETDREAIRGCQDVLRGGGALAVFIEGTRQDSDEIGAARNGAAMLAVSTGVPVVPVCIQGTDRLPWQATVAYGSPIATDGLPRRSATYRALSDHLVEELRRLRLFIKEAESAGRPRHLTPPAARPFVPAS